MPQRTFIRIFYLVSTCACLYLSIFGGFQTLVRYLVNFLQQLSQKHPIAYDALMAVIGVYFSWKILEWIFWFWYRLIVNTIKATFAVSIVVIGFAIYFRGMERLVIKDFPFMYHLLWKNRSMLSHKLMSFISFVQLNPESYLRVGERMSQNFNPDNVVGGGISNAKELLSSLFDTIKDSVLAYANDIIDIDNVNRFFSS